MHTDGYSIDYNDSYPALADGNVSTIVICRQADSHF